MHQNTYNSKGQRFGWFESWEDNQQCQLYYKGNYVIKNDKSIPLRYFRKEYHPFDKDEVITFFII